MAKNREQE